MVSVPAFLLCSILNLSPASSLVFLKGTLTGKVASEVVALGLSITNTTSLHYARFFLWVET